MWLGSVTVLRLKGKQSFVYLTFFTIFYAYIVVVLDATLIQFQSLLLLQYFKPGLILHGQAAGESVNLIPLLTLTPGDLQTSLLNIGLLLPFGFGLPFITDFGRKRVVVLGGLVSLGIELLQLLSGFVARLTFRVADINDVLFNTTGVFIGYLLFVGFVRGSRRLSRNWQSAAHPLVRYIAGRPQLDQ